jgi:putative nucleotidyltransferase with HDIG domain
MNEIHSPPGTESHPATIDANSSVTTILCVDDEPGILAALKRKLRSRDVCVLTAQSGAEALEALERLPVDIVISDMRMPGMDGAHLLEQVALRWPQVVRVLLTGHADVESTVAAVNRGRIYRYLHKPWDDEDLRMMVRQALEMRRLETERLRLEALTLIRNKDLRTLNDELETRVEARTAELKSANVRLQRNHLKTIKAFVDLIELRSGRLSGHGKRVADIARALARQLGLADADELAVFKAALLHDIGLMGADDMSSPVHAGRSPEVEQRIRSHAHRGAQTLRGLDDMAGVADIVGAHHESFDGSGFPAGIAGDAIVLGARILAVADALDELESGDHAAALARDAAIAVLQRGSGSRFDPQVILALQALATGTPA